MLNNIQSPKQSLEETLASDALGELPSIKGVRNNQYDASNGDLVTIPQHRRDQSLH
jgi:hypothetical protein